MDKKKERKLEKEIIWIAGILVAIVVVYLVASSLFRSFNSFSYSGLHFTKERLGELQLYHYSYVFEGVDKKVYKYNLYLRNDPRTNDVPITGDQLAFVRPYTTYLSVDTEGLKQCKYGPLAVGSLARFLKDNQISVEGAVNDFWQAGSQGEEWVTCESKPANKVIEIFSGNTTQITIDNNCYKIEVNNCEVLEAVEKFQIQAILDA